MQFLRKPAISRLLFVSFDQEFGSFEREIRRFGREIELEASLASKQAQKQETELQARGRSRAGTSRRVIVSIRDSLYNGQAEDKLLRQKLDRQKLKKKKLSVLDNLSTYDYQKTYKQIRKECIPGTSSWILEDSKYTAWKDGVGSGKSFLSACVAANLMEAMSPKEVTSFFFCRFDDQSSLEPRTIIGSIARQLVNDVPETDLPEFNNSRPIEEFLEMVLSAECKYSIVLDGLDECAEIQIREISRSIHSLLSSPRLHVKIFWSSRPNIMAWLLPKIRTGQQISLATMENQERIASDISDFVNVTLEEWLEGDPPMLRIRDPAIVPTIVECLETRSHGMFLWVKLQLLTLSEKHSDEQILDTLRHLPRDLPETFARILAKFTASEDIDVGSKIFRWVAVAKRPLRIQELQEALGITPLQDNWNPRCFINDMKKAVACCGNLIFVDEERETLHFTHSSVRLYLLSGPEKMSSKSHHVDLEKADADMGAICITYLNFPLFDRQLARARKTKDDTAAIPSAVITNSLPASANKIALRVLRHRHHTGKSFQRLLEDATGDQLNRRDAGSEQYPFFRYAQNYWLDHTKTGLRPDTKLWKVWFNLLETADRRDILTNQPWTYEDLTDCSMKIVEWTAGNNHCTMAARLLVESENVLSEETERTLLEGAANSGSIALFDILRGINKVPRRVLNQSLQIAAEKGHLVVVERLLTMNANVNAGPATHSKRTALQAAAGGGHLAIVERLLQENAAVIDIPGYSRDTALRLAAWKGHLAVVERLLEANANVNVANGKMWGPTALQAAASGGYLDVVDRLLLSNADVNAPAAGKEGRTALQAAAEGGHGDVVKRLLQAKADVNATAAFASQTALGMAAEGGHLAIVERLLRMGADINAVSSGCESILHAAVRGGNLATVDRLLREKIGVTAMETTAVGDDLEILDRLLQAQPDLNATANAGTWRSYTVLEAAIKDGQVAVVRRLLLEEEVNINRPSDADQHRGMSPLKIAVQEERSIIVTMLKAAGAKD
ncbi:MAG: hypothetical protein Q9168_004036 [Polycauliona sp. 1 TL-2023]